MATIPEPDEPQPTTAQRVRRAVTAPITERTPRTIGLLALAGACVSVSPFPFGLVGAAAAVVAAYEVGRRR